MIWLVKFLHIFGLMLGSAAAFGSFAVARQVRLSAGAPPKELLALRPLFARTALVAIVLLWLTGLWLYVDAYAGVALGWAFHAKLGAATLLLVAIIAVNVVAAPSCRRHAAACLAAAAPRRDAHPAGAGGRARRLRLQLATTKETIAGDRGCRQGAALWSGSTAMGNGVYR